MADQINQHNEQLEAAKTIESMFKDEIDEILTWQKDWMKYRALVVAENIDASSTNWAYFSVAGERLNGAYQELGRKVMRWAASELHSPPEDTP